MCHLKVIIDTVHTGSATTLAPFLAASLIFCLALCKLAALSAPTASCTRARRNKHSPAVWGVKMCVSELELSLNTYIWLLLMQCCFS